MGHRAVSVSEVAVAVNSWFLWSRHGHVVFEQETVSLFPSTELERIATDGRRQEVCENDLFPKLSLQE